MRKERDSIADPLVIERARSGNQPDLEELLARAWPHAFRMAFSILRSGAAAEDAAQEACAVVFRSIGDLRSSDAFGIWFCRIVVREALRIDRRSKPCDVLDRDLPAADGAMSDALVRIDVLRALGGLDPTERAVVMLRYYADLNSVEIARVLGMPAPTVRFHLARARRALERALDGGRELPVGLEGARAL